MEEQGIEKALQDLAKALSVAALPRLFICLSLR